MVSLRPFTRYDCDLPGGRCSTPEHREVAISSCWPKSRLAYRCQAHFELWAVDSRQRRNELSHLRRSNPARI